MAYNVHHETEPSRYQMVPFLDFNYLPEDDMARYNTVPPFITREEQFRTEGDTIAICVVNAQWLWTCTKTSQHLFVLSDINTARQQIDGQSIRPIYELPAARMDARRWNQWNMVMQSCWNNRIAPARAIYDELRMLTRSSSGPLNMLASETFLWDQFPSCCATVIESRCPTENCSRVTIHQEVRNVCCDFSNPNFDFGCLEDMLFAGQLCPGMNIDPEAKRCQDCQVIPTLSKKLMVRASTTDMIFAAPEPRFRREVSHESYANQNFKDLIKTSYQALDIDNGRMAQFSFKCMLLVSTNAINTETGRAEVTQPHYTMACYNEARDTLYLIDPIGGVVLYMDNSQTWGDIVEASIRSQIHDSKLRFTKTGLAYVCYGRVAGLIRVEDLNLAVNVTAREPSDVNRENDENLPPRQPRRSRRTSRRQSGSGPSTPGRGLRI